jgi:membrane-associated phospholipid phosphatase
VSEAGPPLQKALPAVLRPYRAADWLTQGYVALVALLILFFHDGRVDHWPLRLAGHVALILAVHALICLHERWGGRVLDFLRSGYPVMLYTFLYMQTHPLMHMFVPGHLDGYVISMDQTLFGCQPSRALMQWLPYRWVSEPLYFAYFCYYLMVAGVALGLYFWDRRRYARYVTVVSFVFYVCYLIFIVLPVLGPYDPVVYSAQTGPEALVGPERVPPAVSAGPFCRIMAAVYAQAEPRGGGGFPSSHIAVAIATLCFTWTWLRRLRWAHLVLVVLLTVATVYGGYHYVVDAMAGVAAAALLIPIGGWLYERMQDLGTPVTAAPLIERNT